MRVKKKRVSATRISGVIKLPYCLNAGGDVIDDRGFLIPVVQTGRLQYGNEYAAHVRARLLLVDQRRVYDFGHDAKSRNRYNTFRNVYIRAGRYCLNFRFGICTCSYSASSLATKSLYARVGISFHSGSP